MEMYNPPTPGEFILESFLHPQELSIKQGAKQLGLSLCAFQRILDGAERIDADLAQRLSLAFGRSPESWLAMQAGYDRWLARLAAQKFPS